MEVGGEQPALQTALHCSLYVASQSVSYGLCLSSSPFQVSFPHPQPSVLLLHYFHSPALAYYEQALDSCLLAEDTFFEGTLISVQENRG